jgi:hypothetical protein
MLLTKEAAEVLEKMRMDSLYWESLEIITALPEGTKMDHEALYWPATYYQGNGDLGEAVDDYLSAVGNRYLSNAFSLAMIPEGGNIQVMNLDEAPLTHCTSVVGHADTARIFSALIGREIEVNRVSVTLKRGDTLYVGQYSGPRLPEGTSTLPEGAAIAWKKVIVK